MDFINRLVEAESSDSRLFSSYRSFRTLRNIPIRTGVYVSIQASHGHYCHPRATLPLHQYQSMEMAFIRNDSKKFLTVDQVIDDRDIISLFLEHQDYDNIYAFVDVHTIQRLFDYLDDKGLLVP